ncbi:MAG: heavy-metal-associated domain-containing protein [Verrucomicrobiaceae bacterium]|nr:heavy-metal-associated domain-containing protein [Verrucomicrobiaceae bacterium]
MKALSTCLLLLSLFLSQAAFAAETSYTAKMKGIECAGCKKTISRALGKIKGVKTIRITKLGKDQHQLTIVTDGTAEISRADANKALGKDSHYEIISWTKAG